MSLFLLIVCSLSKFDLTSLAAMIVAFFAFLSFGRALFFVKSIFIPSTSKSRLLRSRSLLSFTTWNSSTLLVTLRSISELLCFYSIPPISDELTSLIKLCFALTTLLDKSENTSLTVRDCRLFSSRISLTFTVSTLMPKFSSRSPYSV